MSASRGVFVMRQVGVTDCLRGQGCEQYLAGVKWGISLICRIAGGATDGRLQMHSLAGGNGLVVLTSMFQIWLGIAVIGRRKMEKLD
jgi:hypothetical protein